MEKAWDSVYCFHHFLLVYNDFKTEKNCKDFDSGTQCRIGTGSAAKTLGGVPGAPPAPAWVEVA